MNSASNLDSVRIRQLGQAGMVCYNGDLLFCYYLVMVKNKNFIIKMKENVCKEVSNQKSEIRTITCKSRHN